MTSGIRFDGMATVERRTHGIVRCLTGQDHWKCGTAWFPTLRLYTVEADVAMAGPQELSNR